MAAALPVFATVGTAYRLVWRHAGRLAGVGWPLMAIYVIQQMLILELRRIDLVAGAQTVLTICWLIAVVLSIPVTTSAYRLFILGESARMSLGFQREEWLYVWALLRFAGRYLLSVSLVVAVVAAIVMAAHLAGLTVSAPAALPGGMAVLGAVVAAIVVLGLLTYLAPFVLIFPAAASDRTLALSEAAACGRRAAVRLWVGPLMAALPLVVGEVMINVAIEMATTGLPVVISAPFLSLVTGVGSVVVLFLTAAFVAIAYQRLTRDGGMAATPLDPAVQPTPN